ncbi:hypothetical protein BP6252_07555 [Coleophoma cylindrospora]|uniref:Uncharacterized protein n=1 Tax=Coleophoma cylindrospora TaxID=1849047 RepID=A0A3D8RAB6_9HELO|nr:hypothetical protein BP6252_07555 [Coleophoma cylindrospora]
MAYQDLAPANITGPCITSYCLGSTALPPNKFCTTQINQCTANSRNYTHFFNSSIEERCSYNADIKIAQEFTFCYLQELNGTIQGSGSSWSIFDAVSTVSLPFQSAGTTAAEAAFSMQTGQQTLFSHFFTESQVTDGTVTTSRATTASVTVPTTTTAPTAATQTSATCSSGYLCASLLAGMSITSGSLAPTDTSTGSLVAAAAQKTGTGTSHRQSLNTKALLALAVVSTSLLALI